MGYQSLPFNPMATPNIAMMSGECVDITGETLGPPAGQRVHIPYMLLRLSADVVIGEEVEIQVHPQAPSITMGPFAEVIKREKSTALVQNFRIPGPFYLEESGYIEITTAALLGTVDLIIPHVSYAFRGDFEWADMPLEDGRLDIPELAGLAAILLLIKQDTAGILLDTTAIEADTTLIAADTLSIDAKTPALGSANMVAAVPVTLSPDDVHFGPVGSAAAADGPVHPQLRAIIEAILASRLDTKFDQLDFENDVDLPIDTYYYPSELGLQNDGKSWATFTGTLIEDDALNLTLHLEVTDEADPATATWVKVGFYDDITGAVLTEIVANSSTEEFAFSLNWYHYNYFRLVLTVQSNTNTVIIQGLWSAM